MEALFEMLKSCGDGAFAIDRQQRIVLWNDACADILGYKARDVLSRPCYEVIGGRAENGCLICRRECVLHQKASKRKPIASRDVQTKTKSGRDVWLNISTIAVPSGWRDLSSVLHFVRDVTVRKHIEQSVSELVRDVSRLADQSHDAQREALADGALPTDLTQRESEVLGELGTGATTTELAQRLCISKATARNHIHNIISKLGVRNRLEAVTLAMRDGLL